jgi:hypothetical protein
MLTTAGVTALTMEENPWANCGGTPAAVPTVVAGGIRISAAVATAPSSPLLTTKLSFDFMDRPSINANG